MPALGDGVVTLPSDREFRVTRVFDAPRNLVFDAWTNPRWLPQWLLGPGGWTMPVCEIDLRVGGRYRFGWNNSGGTDAQMVITGTYGEIDPPGRLVTTETWGEPWPETVNTIEFTEQEGRTTMVLTVLYPTKEARDAALQTGASEGMKASFDGLAALVATMR